MEDVPPVLNSQSSQPHAPQPAPPPTSLLARLLNVFAMPGAVFEEIKASGLTPSNWLVPLLLLAPVSGWSLWLLFSQPSLQHRIEQAQTQALTQQVKAGSLTQTQADQLRAAWSHFTQPPILQRTMAAAGGLGAVLMVLWWGLLLWLLGRCFLKARFSFFKSLEAAGLAMMIKVLGTAVMILLTVDFSELMQSSGSRWVFGDFETTRNNPAVLFGENAFSFWLAAVLASALSRLAGVVFPRAAFLVFACWLLQQSLALLVAGGLGN